MTTVTSGTWHAKLQLLDRSEESVGQSASALEGPDPQSQND